VASASKQEKVYPGVNQSRSFCKVPLDPSLFKIAVRREDLEHLAADDLDEISKFEVVYKILKDQLRDHQKRLIKLKAEEEKEKERKKEERELARLSSASPDKSKKGKGKAEEIDLKDFVKHIKPFEWYGAQRDLSPELKRIVKNLTCQEHSYVYCACCK